MDYKRVNKEGIKYTEKFFEEILKCKEKYAKEFCEGDQDLYNLLINLWERNLITIGCCKGHDSSTKYIGFELDHNNSILLKILSALPKKDIIITFTANTNTKHVGIRAYKDKNIDLFAIILNSLISLSENQEINLTIKKISDYITNYQGNYFTVNIKYSEEDEEIDMVTQNSEVIEKFKQKYPYTLINEKQNAFYFKLK